MKSEINLNAQGSAKAYLAILGFVIVVGILAGLALVIGIVKPTSELAPEGSTFELSGNPYPGFVFKGTVVYTPYQTDRIVTGDLFVTLPADAASVITIVHNYDPVAHGRYEHKWDSGSCLFTISYSTYDGRIINKNWSDCLQIVVNDERIAFYVRNIEVESP
jgi:hypothetical protein